MKHKSFYVWLMISVIVFAAVSLGGCGGSSNLAQESIYQETQEDVGVSMSYVWDDDAAQDEIFSQITSEDVAKLLGLRMVTIGKNDNGSIITQYFNMVEAILEGKEYPETAYSSAEILAHYESGDVIAIVSADMALVNTVRADLGLDEEDANKFGTSGKLEVYALSCQKVDGIRNLFVYAVPKMEDMFVSDMEQILSQDIEFGYETSADILPDSQDETQEKAEELQYEYTMQAFQIRRWVNFIKWMGDMSVIAVNNAAFASEYKVRAAADGNLISMVDAQTEVFDLSYNNEEYKFEKLFDGKYSYTFSRSRSNFVTVTIYPVHSFTNGKDYYIVQSSTATQPENIKNTLIEVDTYKRHLVCGYTKSITTEHFIDGGGTPVSDVTLSKHTPASIGENSSYSENIDWKINGNLGVKKDGTAVLSENAGFSKNVSWSTSDYKIVNDCTKEYPAGTKWCIDVTDAKDGADQGRYVEVKPTPASLTLLQYDTYFMWELDASYWLYQPTHYMDVKLTVEDGFCLGYCGTPLGIFYYNRFNCPVQKTLKQCIKLQRPPHVLVNKNSFAFTAAGSNSEVFELVIEGQYRFRNIPSWITITNISRLATNNKGRQIFFKVRPNTTGAPREATMIIGSGSEIAKIQLTQAAD